jgi:hypothetical protein
VYASLVLMVLMVSITVLGNGTVSHQAVTDEQERRAIAPPLILTPKQGDTVGKSVTVSGTSSCPKVVITVTPTAGSPQSQTVNVVNGQWQVIFHDISSNISIKACCFSDPPPHAPCSAVNGVLFEDEEPIEIDFAHGTGQFHKLKSGTLEIKGRYLKIERRKQSILVMLEKVDLKDPKTDRVLATSIDINLEDWTAKFGRVEKGRYIVRAFVIGRDSPVKSTSRVIDVE